MRSKNVLLIGSNGQLGTYVYRQLVKRRCNVYAPNSQHVDLSLDHDTLYDRLQEYHPDLVINAAAYNNVTEAETEQGNILAQAINHLGVETLVRFSESRGIPIVTFSTDYVFDGKLTRPYDEFDTPSPVNNYGTSKLEGELVALDYKNALVIRTSGLYSKLPCTGKTGKRNFPEFVIDSLAKRSNIKLINNIYTSPTFCTHLVQALFWMLDRRMYGIWHCANTGWVSWYEFGQAIAEISGHRNEFIQPIQSLDTTLKRPMMSALSSKKLEQFGYKMPDWLTAVKEYLKCR